MKKSDYVGAAIAVLLSAGRSVVWAADGVWSGVDGGLWTNGANWSASPYPSGTDTAIFSGDGNGNTVIDLLGLPGISFITFASPDVAAYMIGTEGQTLVMPADGLFRISADAGNSQTFNATVRLGPDASGGAYTFRNDSAGRALTFAGAVLGSSGGTAGTKYLTLEGVGPVLFSGGIGRGGSSGLVLTNATSGAVTLAGDNMLKALILTGADGGVVDIGAGELYLSNAGTLVINAERDAVIGGAGTLRLSTNDDAASTGFDYSNIIVADGKTLVINTPVTGPGGIEFNSGTGTLVLNGINTSEAHVGFNAAGTISVAKIGNAGSTDSNLGKGSIIRAFSTASGSRLLYTGTGETSDRVIRLERSLTLEHAGSGTLTFSSDLDVRGNTKTLTLQGDTEGLGVLAGAVSAGSGTTSLTKRGSGTWILGGANGYTGETAIYGGGPLVLTHPAAVAGTSQVRFYSANGLPGVLELAHDGAGEAPFNVVIGVGHNGTILSGNASGNSAGINHVAGNLNLSSVVLTIARADSIVSGSPAVTFGVLNLSAGSSGTTTLNPTTADMVLGGAAILSNGGYAKTLRLAGQAAGNRVDGVISNGLNRLSVEKTDVSVWALTAANTYTGTTTVAEGTLTLAGSEGAILASSGITLTGGMLVLDNVAVANANRVGDDVPVTLAGGALVFAHDGEAAENAETLGVLNVASGNGTVSVARAAEGQSSSLTFAALAYAGGTVNFEGEGLGEDARNRILFATPPVLRGGIIGPWAKVNGTHWATYDPVKGVTAYIPASGSETEINARGPDSVIPDDAEKPVRITGDGTEGHITLAADETEVATLTQANPTFEAKVDMAGKTLRTSAVALVADAAPLTLGVAPGEGVLSAPAAGGALSLSNDSESGLTVNAALADNGTDALLSTFGTGTVALSGPIAHTGPVGVNGGALTFAGHEVAQAVAGPIAGVGGLVKTGTNVLHLLGENTYAGTTLIHAGVLRVDKNTALGAASGGTVIADGATLDLGCTSDVGGSRTANTLNMQAEPITVSGFGAAGAGGAIVNRSASSQYNALGNVTLAGDVRFGGSARWDIRNGTLKMNGHTVTKVGSSVVALSGVEVTPDGDSAAIEVVEGTLRLQTSTRLNGGAANTITLRSGTSLDFYQVAEPQMWTLNLDDGATVFPTGGTAASLHNRWGGAVVLNGAAMLDYSAGPLDMQGPISGVGSLTKVGSGSVTVSGTGNTYTGTTSVLRGRLVVSSIRNVGEPCSLGQPSTIEAGVISLGATNQTAALEYFGAGDTTDRVIDMSGTTGGANLYHNGTGPLKFTSDLRVSVAGAKKLAFYGTSAVPAEFAGVIADDADRKINVEKYDSGDWTLSGNNLYTDSTRVYGGALTFSGNNTLPGSVNVYGGTLTFSGSNTCSGTVTVFDRLNLAGSDGGLTGLYQINGSMVVSGVNDQDTGNVRIGSSSNSNGVMRVLSGAAYTGAGAEFHVGYGTGSSGALYVEGGVLARTATSGDKQLNVAYGQGSYGYLNVSGGSVSSGARLTVGGYSTTLSNGIGIVRMTGGTLSAPSYVLLGRNAGSVGIMTVQGSALFDHANGSQNFILCQNGGRADLNLLGGTVDSSGRDVSAKEGSTGIAMATVNLCAGLLTANRIYRAKAGDFVWVNFRGGTFKASTAGTPLDANLAAVTLFGASGGFAGGAVIDTDGKAVTVSAPLAAPAGNGVADIALAAGGSGYLGEPLVTITPPPAGGVPATAVAEMMPDGNGTYRVASVTITCPGTGYTEVPGVSFSGGGNGAVAPTVGSVTLAANASGGLTKTGAGTLTLTAANTYTGVTTVAGGTLALGNAKALPTQTPVVLAGGTLDLNGYTVTNGLTAAGGSVVNGTLETVLSPGGAGTVGTNTVALSGAALTGTYLADVRADGACDRVIVEGDVNLGGLTLTLVDPGQLDISREYTLLSCTGTLSGALACGNLPAGRWRVVTRPDKTAVLLFTRGTLMRIH